MLRAKTRIISRLNLPEARTERIWSYIPVYYYILVGGITLVTISSRLQPVSSVGVGNSNTCLLCSLQNIAYQGLCCSSIAPSSRIARMSSGVGMGAAKSNLYSGL